MSLANVEVVRRAYAFLERGELPLEVSDPAIRLDNIAESPIPGPYFGHEGLHRWWEELVETAPGLRLELAEVIDVGDDRIVGVLRWYGTPLVEQMPPWAAVHWVRGGLIFRTAGYLTKQQALEAVGLSE